MCFFFFKQKTAYEMRISDWSSDVCSSDLNADVNGERRTLWIVLLLNSAIAAAFLVTGAIGDSSALIANGLDNLSDAAVYALSLVALTRGMKWKTRAATEIGRAHV